MDNYYKAGDIIYYDEDQQRWLYKVIAKNKNKITLMNLILNISLPIRVWNLDKNFYIKFPNQKLARALYG